MIKQVNVRTNTEIRNIATPIYSNKQNIAMNTKDIRTCLMKGAYVYEILEDGSTIRLDLTNYNKEHTVSTVVNFSEEKKEPVVISNENNDEITVIAQEPAVVTEPAVEEPEATTEETVVEDTVAETNEEVTVEETVETAEEPEATTEETVVEDTVAESTKTSTSKKKRK